MIRRLLPVFALLFSLVVRGSDDRIWMDGTVNGDPVHLFFDSGAPEFYLFRRSATRLGFEIPELISLEPWTTFYADSKCRLECPGFKGKIRPIIIEPPSFAPVGKADGFVGWKMIHKNFVQIDAANGSITILKETPAEVKAWTRFKVRSQKPSGWRRWGILAIELPKDANPSGGIVIIDTGSPNGIGLPDAVWREWKLGHTNVSLTLVTGLMPSAGILALEQAWAREFQLGPVALSDVTLGESESWSQGMARNRHAATLGMEALARLDLVVDGKAGWAYLRGKTNTVAPPTHNRLGAAFAPKDEKSRDLIAKVLPHTPAAEADIQNGDILLKVNGRDVTRWRETSAASWGAGALWAAPAGTRLRLTLRRGTEAFEKEVVLRDLMTN